MAKDREEMEVMNMIGLVLVKRAVLKYVYNVRMLRKLRRGALDHFVAQRNVEVNSYMDKENG